MAEAKKRNLVEYLMLTVRGIIMGAADVVPGVSGGTMAFILGIYEELLDSIKKFSSFEAMEMYSKLQFRKAYNELPWRFMLFLASGIAAAFLTLAGPIKWMLDNQPAQIWAFFFGLVLASVVAVWPRVKKWNFTAYVSLVIGGVFAYWLVGVVPTQTTNDLWFITFCGALAICAMILPGISGSFILLLLGKYHYMLGAIENVKQALPKLDFATLWTNGIIIVCFMIGIVVGLSSFVRLLGWLFRKYHDITVAVLIGFMLGSLRKVWPWKQELLTQIVNGKKEVLSEANVMPPDYSGPVLWAIAFGIFGFILVLVIEYVANKKEKAKA